MLRISRNAKHFKTMHSSWLVGLR